MRRLPGKIIVFCLFHLSKLAKLQTFCLLSNGVTAEHGLDVVHFAFVGECVLKNQVVINQVKNPIFTSKVGLL
jgi:hypothetical protein